MKDDPGLASWLKLTLTPGLGAGSIRALLQQFGLPQEVFQKSYAELARHAPAEALRAFDSERVKQAVDATLAWAKRPENHVITLADQAYPRTLLEIPDPPTVLYAVGRVALLQGDKLAIVGSRNATSQGERNAESFAKTLGEAGLTIVSGLAMGIDAAAHRGGLGTSGSTITVLGTGVDVVYPRRNEDLAAAIAKEGLLLSEFPLGTPPVAHNFPRRNRLISGLGRGCLVVEAAAASGSLITARLAADQGRDVFAIPGSIHSPLSKGCHALIKAGAKLVESADDILAELSGFQRTGFASTVVEDDDRSSELSCLLKFMGHDPVDVDWLCVQAGLSAEQVSSELLRLELAGRIAALPGGLYQRLSKGGG